MSVNSEHYAKQAEYCRSMADQAKIPDLKEGWLKLANAWQQMILKSDPAPSREANPGLEKTRRIWPG